ncbi:MAG: hypothetical protein GX556_10560 [Fibrobacter sp.]|nr:hypothetical protein [Fibrobacter sp.]
MNLWFAFYVLILVLILYFSIRTYLRTSALTHVKIVLIGIRVAIILLLTVAFFEPELRFRKLPSGSEQVSVLIDASISMQLFNSDSTINSFLLNLQNRRVNGKDCFSFYLFGDSLRKIEKVQKVSFSDRSSFFPQYLQHNSLKNTGELIIISDANWSNAAFSPEPFYDKNVRFALLPPPGKKPFLKIKAPETLILPADSSVSVPVELEGVIAGNENPSVTVYESGKALIQKTIKADSGYFSTIVNLILPAASPGKHLYRIEAFSRIDSTRSTAWLLHHALPQTFTWAQAGSSQLLDRRFYSLALKRRDDFRESRKNEKSDLVFLFNTSELEGALSILKPDGIIVFAGCLPCSSRSISWPPDGIIGRNKSGFQLSFGDIKTEDFPPLSEILQCPRLKGTPYLSLFSDRSGKKDTVQLIFSTNLKNKNALVIASRDIWKWDFWPMSVSRQEEESFLFSDHLISVLKEMLLANLSDRFFAWPQYLNNSESARFALSFPSEIPVSSSLKISFQFSDLSGKPLKDTTFNIINTGSAKQYAILQPLEPGAYLFSSSASFENRTFSFKDSLYAEPDRSEFMVTGQNTAVLKEFGREIDLNDSSAIAEVFSNRTINTEASVNSFRITRSWFLLIAIFLLLLTEWGYRRFSGLD